MNTRLFIISIVFASCSGNLALPTSGVSFDIVQKIHTKKEFQELDALAVGASHDEHGHVVEIYKIEYPVEIASGLVSGLVDFFAPKEEDDEKKFYTVKVTFDCEENVQKIELL